MFRICIPAAALALSACTAEPDILPRAAEVFGAHPRTGTCEPIAVTESNVPIVGHVCRQRLGPDTLALMDGAL